MRIFASIVLLCLACSPAQARVLEMPLGTYDCEIGQVDLVEKEGGTAEIFTLTAYSEELRQFQIHFGNEEAFIDWPSSPIDVSGSMTVLPTGASSGMILTIGDAPCSLTGNPCAAMVNFGAQSDGSLALLIVPTAVSAANEMDGSRTPLLVAIDGSCTEASR